MGSLSDISRVETWSFHNSWISETFLSRDADAILAKALHCSISGDVSSTTTSDSFCDLLSPSPQRLSNKNILPPAPLGKITKRKKPRACKRSLTTFITADPTNFRQMVQQVTGVQFETTSLLKPEAQRPTGVVNRIQAGYLMPTLDTSAYWLDHHHQQQPARSSLGFAATGDVAAGVDLDGLSSSFPTLDSWKVM